MTEEELLSRGPTQPSNFEQGKRQFLLTDIKPLVGLCGHRGALCSGCLPQAGLLVLPKEMVRKYIAKALQTDKTQTFWEEEMWLLSSPHYQRHRAGCVHRTVLARVPVPLWAAAMYSGWWNSAVSNRDRRRWPWWCSKGECPRRGLQRQWGCRGEGGFRQANKPLFFSGLTSGNCRGCSLSKNHLLPFFPHISSKWSHGWEVPKVIFQSLVFLIWKNVLHFSKRKKKRDKKNYFVWNQKLKPPKPSLWSELGVTWINTSIDFKI